MRLRKDPASWVSALCAPALACTAPAPSAGSDASRRLLLRAGSLFHSLCLLKLGAVCALAAATLGQYGEKTGVLVQGLVGEPPGPHHQQTGGAREHDPEKEDNP